LRSIAVLAGRHPPVPLVGCAGQALARVNSHSHGTVEVFDLHRPSPGEAYKASYDPSAGGDLPPRGEQPAETGTIIVAVRRAASIVEQLIMTDAAKRASARRPATL
jgi:hypothetical protein